MKPSLSYPLESIHVNQGFGQNLNPIYAQQGLKGHSGLDLMATHGTPVYATHDGVCYPKVDDHGGNGVSIMADGFYTISWHLIDDDAVVHTGDKVKAGDLIGYADSTGISTGDHLHFGLLTLPADVNNGYKGFVDPTPYFNGKYPRDFHTQKFQFTKFLKFGSFNSEVNQLQILLQKLGYYKGAIDGDFRDLTDQAVKQFQTKEGLVSDGKVGPKTRTVLNSLIYFN